MLSLLHNKLLNTKITGEGTRFSSINIWKSSSYFMYHKYSTLCSYSTLTHYVWASEQTVTFALHINFCKQCFYVPAFCCGWSTIQFKWLLVYYKTMFFLLVGKGVPLMGQHCPIIHLRPSDWLFISLMQNA